MTLLSHDKFFEPCLLLERESIQFDRFEALLLHVFTCLWNSFGIGRVEPSWMTKCMQQNDTNALIINTRQGLYAAAVTWPGD